MEPATTITLPGSEERMRLQVTGAVQGVGFRPFVHRLATRLELGGWVRNGPRGVTIEAEGPPERLAEFRRLLHLELPACARIDDATSTPIDALGESGFEVRASEEGGEPTALILPDFATCPECLREIFDASDRRHLYPFTNCTHCGPRFTIITALPYDRPNTTMRGFRMCEACRAEYEDPANRRFHAQPNACPRCGPHVELWDRRGRALASHHVALADAAARIRSGATVAVKGLGGFHLMVNALDEEAVARLRRRKGREEKPFALMFPSLTEVKRCCLVSPSEEKLLTSPESPIVLLRRAEEETDIADGVAPGNPHLGVMLPHSPLHHVLMRETASPVVATSGNLSEEPICTDEREALSRLGDIADVFLMHNRPIARHADDSVARVVMDEPQVIRRARGFAPLPVALPKAAPPMLAVGAHQKSTVAIAVGPSVFISQHIGDLDTAPAVKTHRRVATDLAGLYAFRPQAVVCDAHPDYASTAFAESLGLPVRRVQHHIAHVFACMAENNLDPPLLGVAWDGTGWGPDGTVWGGEFFHVTDTGIRRVAHLRPFPLPGGEAAVREPWRCALGLLWELHGGHLSGIDDLAPMQFAPRRDVELLSTAMARGVNAPRTSSAGRLFDAVAALAGLRQTTSFEGQAAMELEHAAHRCDDPGAYEFEITPDDGRATTAARMLDWGPMVEAIVSDVRAGLPAGVISAKFHRALALVIAAVALIEGEPHVALTGGCFQSRLLTEWSVRALRAMGFTPHRHRLIPPGDGGIALGQIVAAVRGCGEE